jgi:hypothetical protein
VRPALLTNPGDGEEWNRQHGRRARFIFNGDDEADLEQVLPDHHTSDRPVHLLDEYVKLGRDRLGRKDRG